MAKLSVVVVDTKWFCRGEIDEEGNGGIIDSSE
jgi:hypothetical protein